MDTGPARDAAPDPPLEEDVLARLTRLGGRVRSYGPKGDSLAVSVLRALRGMPDEVMAFVFGRVSFVLIDAFQVTGLAFLYTDGTRHASRWAIVMSEHWPERDWPEWVALYVASAWVRRNHLEALDAAPGDKEAVDLARSWALGM